MLEFTVGNRGLIEGTLAAIRYQNARDGFTVAELECVDGRRIDVVGPLAAAEVGMPILLLGSIETDPRFGLQFVIESQVDPVGDAELARNYLASGLVSYIGPTTASAIVAEWGSDTLRRLALEPETLAAFRGVTVARLPAVKRSLRASLHLASVVGLLDPFGVSLRVAQRIWRRHGPRAVEMIRANPWRLANEIAGVGFRTADKIALGLGVAMDAPERMEAAVLQTLRNAATDGGHILLSRNIVVAGAAGMASARPAAIEEAIERLIVSEEVEFHSRGLALPHLAAAERIVAAKLRTALAFDEEAITIDASELAEIEAAEKISFDASQQRAVVGCLAERVAIITGNPGTGKTTIVRAVLDLAERHGLSVALVSPTGRAAKRLAEATRRPASTIHRWLRYHPERGFVGPEKIPDLLVVDESSMIDSLLAARLLTVLPPYVRLLFVGDADQLPAVGPGNVLGDMINSGRVAVFRLTHIHRTAAGSGVPAFATDIVNGEFPRPDHHSTRFVRRETAEEIASYIKETIAKNAERIAEFQVLCPMRKGAAGTDALNRAIQEIINPPKEGQFTLRRSGFELRVGDRVMATHNDYNVGMFNGEIGILRQVAADGSIQIELDDQTLDIPAGGGEGLTLAYAITVHKGQGSEFPIVLVPMHQSFYMLLERRVLYTAVSRATQTVAIVGTPVAVGMALRRHDPLSRQTLLQQLLGETDTDGVLPALPDVAEEDF